MAGQVAAVGALVPGAGIRVLLTALSFEHADHRRPAQFAASPVVAGWCHLMAASWDAPTIGAAWAVRAGWSSIDLSMRQAEGLGVLILGVGLLAPALFVVGDDDTVLFRQVAASIADQVDFAAAAAVLEAHR